MNYFNFLPNDAGFYYNEGIGAMQAGNIRDAIGYFNEAIRLDAYFSLAYTNRGVAYTRLDLLENAITDFDQAILCDPSNSALVSSE